MNTLQSQKNCHFIKPQISILYKATNINTLQAYNINTSQSHKHQQFTELKTSTLHKATNINNFIAKNINTLQSKNNQPSPKPKELVLSQKNQHLTKPKTLRL
jgi:hypothetical protein